MEVITITANPAIDMTIHVDGWQRDTVNRAQAVDASSAPSNNTASSTTASASPAKPVPASKSSMAATAKPPTSTPPASSFRKNTNNNCGTTSTNTSAPRAS